ncbi:MAG: hypothetical protein LAQ30_09435 [Acidobacteriia bacterium]|nr:hypothetical protein [Terriglobia bacterium]
MAELEDKLSKLHITEEEMKTYQKVSAALASGMANMPAVAQPATTPAYQLQPCYLCYRHWTPPHWWTYQQCYECGPGGPGPVINPGSFTTMGR